MKVLLLAPLIVILWGCPFAERENQQQVQSPQGTGPKPDESPNDESPNSGETAFLKQIGSTI